MSEFIESSHLRDQAESPHLTRLRNAARHVAIKTWAHIERATTVPSADEAPYQRRASRSFTPRIGTALLPPPQNTKDFADLQTDEVLLIDPVTEDQNGV